MSFCFAGVRRFSEYVLKFSIEKIFFFRFKKEPHAVAERGDPQRNIVFKITGEYVLYRLWSDGNIPVPFG